MLLKYINNNTGIRYRELLRKTNLANGVLSYHLRILERSKNIKVYRIRYSRTSYYPKGIKGSDWIVINCLSNKVFVQIIKFILKRKGSSRFVEIQKYIDRSPSTTSWYIKKLKDARIISVSIDKPSKYTVINKARIARIVFKYTN